MIWRSLHAETILARFGLFFATLIALIAADRKFTLNFENGDGVTVNADHWKGVWLATKMACALVLKGHIEVGYIGGDRLIVAYR